MSTALYILQIIFYSIAIVFMLTFMIVGIWSFVLFVKTCKTQKIKNNLLDKLNENISNLSNITPYNNDNSEDISTDLLSDFDTNDNEITTLNTENTDYEDTTPNENETL